MSSWRKHQRQLSPGSGTTWVIGGAQLYAQALPAADRVELTEIGLDVDGDTVAPGLGDGWDARAAYNLERMTAHGARRAAEMEEAAKTLAALGVEPVMTRGTVIRQRAMAANPMEQAA